MTYERRQYDSAIAEIQKDIKAIMHILSPLDSNKMGLCERVRNNTEDIGVIKHKSIIVKSWMVAAAVIINTVIAGIALIK